MHFILIVMLISRSYGGYEVKSGFSTEFNSAQACQAASVEIGKRVDATMVCVAKGKE